MKTIFNEIPTMTLDEFAEKHGLVMEVNERRLPVGNPSRFYARFKDVEVKDRSSLVIAFGNGETPDEAIKNYAKRINLEKLVVGSMTPTRRELSVPRLH